MTTIHYSLWMHKRNGGRKEFSEHCETEEEMNWILALYEMASLYGLTRGLWIEWD